MTMQTRQRAYAAMNRLTEDVQSPAVLILIDGENVESHVQISDPTTEDLAQLKLVGQKALYALSLYLNQIDGLIAAAAQDAQTAQS